MIVTAPVAAVLLLAGALLGIPVVIGGNGGSPTASCRELAVILDTIRTVESGGDYSVSKNQGGASGAYQYVDSTWSNYEGHASAYLAPPEMQDARAATDVEAILATYGDIAYVPIVWYWPRAATDPSQLDIVPMPDAGNRLTVREYQQRWLATYETKLSGSSATGCAGVLPTEDGYVLPVDRALVAASPSVLDAPHHDYPAIDIVVPEGSPVYAVRGGTVARVVNWPHNCSRVRRCEQTCGVGLSINGDDGARYVYCHATRHNRVAVGDVIAAGQLVMWSGNTGRSGTPHLHLEIRADGRQRCPQSMLQAIYESSRSVLPSALPADGCSY